MCAIMPRANDTHLREPLETTEANLARLVQSLQQKNCVLEPTCTDGNCGLDAIISNLKRLELTEPALVQKVHTVLNKKDLKSACQVLRLGLLLWIKDNEHEEILPDVRLLDWMVMEGYTSKADYISAMKQDGEWIDTLMLFAASAVFQAQVVVFLEDGSPHVLAAPDVQAMASSPIFLLANIGNVHFYGVRPLPTVLGKSKQICCMRPAPLKMTLALRSRRTRGRSRCLRGRSLSFGLLALS